MYQGTEKGNSELEYLTPMQGSNRNRRPDKIQISKRKDELMEMFSNRYPQIYIDVKRDAANCISGLMLIKFS